MLRKNILIFFFSISTVVFILYSQFSNETGEKSKDLEKTEELSYKSNIINDVNYTTKDANGHEYIINASKGEIDFENSRIIFLTKVNALIRLKNKDELIIKSDYGKYNSENFDTIFSKNVKINYLDNEITSDYLDFSLKRNSMIISKNVIYQNNENILNADVLELNIKTKDVKIFMFEKKEKVNIKSKK